MITKPILHNGFILENGTVIKKRVEKIFFTEIYLLSDNQYLYIFPNISFEEVITDISQKINILNVNNKKLLSVIIPEYSPEKVTEIIEKLTVRKGLDCVAGMKELKALLINDVINPLTNQEKYKRFKLTIPNGILLYGPPGCGKTFIVKKLAEHLNYTYIELRPSSIATPYVHGAVSNIAKIFEIAKLKAPTIIFIDEIEGIIPRREDLASHADTRKEEINEFLLQLNNASENKILVIGATNRPHIIDLAILRSGRMDKRIFVGPPDIEAREEIIKLCLSGRPYDKNINFTLLAQLTENHVSSDIELAVTESARLAILENRNSINEDMLIKSINKLSISVTSEQIQYYTAFSNLERW